MISKQKILISIFILLSISFVLFIIISNYRKSGASGGGASGGGASGGDNVNNMVENFYASYTRTQNGNLIKYVNLTSDANINLSTITNSETNSETNRTYKLCEFELDGLYTITDLNLSGISGNVSIGIFNNNSKQLDYIKLQDDELSSEKIKKNIDTGSKILNINNVVNQYENYIIGNKVHIYLLDNQNQISNSSNSSNISICGILSTESLSVKLNDILDKNSTDITSPNGNSLLNSKNKLSHISRDDKLYKITTIELNSNGSNVNSFINTPLNILYTNSYTNEIMVYTSDRSDGTFLLNNTFSKIFLYDNILLANKINIHYINSGGVVVDLTNRDVKIKGYLATNNDINSFKLENNLTDIRGSINPDDICRGIDGLLKDQISSEIIIDSLEYQEKIKDEKIKLQSNKEGLLHLLEQKEDLERVSKMLNKINELKDKRQKETDALNAIKLTKQINEINKLKEVLDARITQNKNNTFNLDKINLNLIKRIDLTEETDKDVAIVEGFQPNNNNNNNNNIPLEENYNL
jgi:hypothetical protein